MYILINIQEYDLVINIPQNNTFKSLYDLSCWRGPVYFAAENI